MINVQEEDEALYMCIVKNSAGEANREFQLVVICKHLQYNSKALKFTVVFYCSTTNHRRKPGREY